MPAQRTGTKRKHEAPAGMSLESPLALLLLKRWSEGALSAADVQEIALASSRSSADSADVEALGALGAFGSQPGNTHRDLVRKFFKEISMPEPYQLQTKIWSKTKDGKALKQDAFFPILLPHQWVATLQRAGKEEVLGTSQVHEFWACQTLANPRLKKSQEYLESCGDWKADGPLPFSFHGDAAPHTEIDGLMVLSMRSICSKLPVHLSQLLLLVAPKSIITPEMWTAIWDVLAWSFEALAQGKMPGQDMRGLPLQEKGELPRGMVFAITGDLEFFYQEFKFPRPNTAKPCPWCKCNQSNIPWNDFRSTAKWREKLNSPEELMAAFDHKLFCISGVNPLAICLDTLHTLDLGVTCHIIGNVLWELLEAMPQSRDVAMKLLNEKIQRKYAKLGVPAAERMHSIAHKELRKKATDYPILKHQKGARVRKFVPVLYLLAKEATESHHDQQRLELLKGLKDMYECLEEKTVYRWNVSLRAKFDSACSQTLKHYGWLAKESFQNKECLWSQVQKHHLTLHLPGQAKWLAPCHYWTYGSESFMGTMVKLASACLHGTPARKVPQAMLDKYRFFWTLMLENKIQED